jgi:hypothetical protein
MSTMFGGGGGASPASWSLTKDLLGKNQAEQDRLTKEAAMVDELANDAGTSAKSMADAADRMRVLGIKNPNPLMTTGYTGVANYGGSRTLGQSFTLGT